MNYKGLYIGQKIARKTFRKYHGFYPEHVPPDKVCYYNPSIEGILGMYRKTRVFCSNPFCCGNPRKTRGSKQLTIQERKALIGEKEQYKEAKWKIGR